MFAWVKLKVLAKPCLIKPVSLDDLIHLLRVPRFVLHKLDISIETSTGGLAARVFSEDCCAYICEALSGNWAAKVFNLRKNFGSILMICAGYKLIFNLVSSGGGAFYSISKKPWLAATLYQRLHFQLFCPVQHAFVKIECIFILFKLYTCRYPLTRFGSLSLSLAGQGILQ